MCRFQCNQQCCPSRQNCTQSTDKLKTEQQFMRNNNVKFFSPDSSDESDDDDHHHNRHHNQQQNRWDYNYVQSCHDNFFRSFANPCHENDDDDGTSLPMPSSDMEVYGSEQQSDLTDQQDSKTSSSSSSLASSIDGGSSRLKSILSSSTKSSLSTEKLACERRRVTFADRWGMELASYRTIPSRHVGLFIDELELVMDEASFPEHSSDYWCLSLSQQGKGKLPAWSFDEPEELAIC